MRKTHRRVTPHTHLNQESSPQPLGVRRALQPIEPQRPGQTSEELLSIRYRSCPLSSVTEVILHKDKRAWPLANTGNTEKAGNAVSQSAATLSAGRTTGSPPAFLQCRGLAQPREPELMRLGGTLPSGPFLPCCPSPVSHCSGLNWVYPVTRWSVH